MKGGSFFRIVIVFLLFVNVSASEIVSEDYSVDSFSSTNIGGTGESNDFLFRSATIPANGAIFEDADYDGEIKVLPMDFIPKKIIDDDDDDSESTGGSSSGGSGGASSGGASSSGSSQSSNQEKTNSNSGSSSASDNSLVNYTLEIFDFEMPRLGVDVFNFEYIIKTQANVAGEINVSYWLEKEGLRLSFNLEEKNLSSGDNFESGILYLENGFEYGNYTLFLALSENESVFDSHDFTVINSPSKLYRNIGFLIAVIIFLFILIVLIIYIRGKYVHSKFYEKKNKNLMKIGELNLKAEEEFYCRGRE